MSRAIGIMTEWRSGKTLMKKTGFRYVAGFIALALAWASQAQPTVPAASQAFVDDIVLLPVECLLVMPLSGKGGQTCYRKDKVLQLQTTTARYALLGDFNVIPEDKDVWAPAAMASDALMQPESRDAYARLIADGWTDALGALNPAGGVWTYWDYQAGAWQRDHGFRIDHALPDESPAARRSRVEGSQVAPGLFLCGDHCTTASINGALTSGRACAEAVLALG